LPLLNFDALALGVDGIFAPEGVMTYKEFNRDESGFD